MHAALVWIDRHRAVVTRTDPTGAVHVTTFSIPAAADPVPCAAIVHALADANAVVVLGDPVARLAFERTYVSIVKHPERLQQPPWVAPRAHA